MLIRCRGWNENKNIMYSPEVMATDQLTLMPDGSGFINVSGDSTRLSQFLRHIKPVFFTGLRDKNGKEIYEGDLLGGTWGDGYIGYCDKCKSFEYFSTVFSCMACEGDVTWRELVENDGKLEVIGNIYESSNLLDTKT